MCVVIDVCAFNDVFKKESETFIPVRKWLFKGKGRMVFGGSTYERELKKMAQYIPIIAELRRAGKVVIIDRDAVDESEDRVRRMEPNPDFDDQHLVAIVDESGCRVICTLDARADRYLCQARFYLKSRKPKIYRQSSHSHLLCDKNIVGACLC